MSAGTPNPPTAGRPQTAYPQIQHHPYSSNSGAVTNPNSTPHQQGILYPVSYSGRGFLPRPPDHPVTSSASVAYQPRAHRPGVGASASPRALPHHVHIIRQYPTTTHLQHHPQQQLYVSAPAPTAPATSIKGLPATGQLKVAPSPSPVSESNGYKQSRDRNREDAVVTVKDRKVRIVDGASLYALCRSWLRNGYPEESQPQYGDNVKCLPRPLPVPVVDSHSPKKKEGEEEVEQDTEDEESVDHLSTRELLKRHVTRAKKVRARLREERLKRIARYKTRLALLLPPQVEQLKNDTAAGN